MLLPVAAPVLAPASTIAVPELPYEHKVWPYRLILPVMFAMAAYAQIKKHIASRFGIKPKYNCFFGDGLSTSGRIVRDGARTWRALEAVYEFRDGVGANAFLRAADQFYMNIRNAQAARNRLRMAMRALRAEIVMMHQDGLVAPGEPVRILSLAAGSARGVIGVIKEMKDRGFPAKVFLIDTAPEALSYARRLAAENGGSEEVSAAVEDVINFRAVIRTFKPDIVEMMGLTDYLSDELAIKLFRMIRIALKPDGFFFTSNVHPNSERYFLKQVVNWDMIYRTKEQLADLFVKAGFPSPKVVPEPHGIQSFAYARKR
jgi:SAM-dependent methyltransferase